MSLFDIFKKVSKRPVKTQIATVSRGGSRSTFRQYPDDGLTPQKLTAILKNADLGYISDQMELFEAMERKDGHLFSILQTRKTAVSGLPWSIIPASDEKKDIKIADFVRDVFESLRNFEDNLFELSDSIAKSFSALEIMWRASRKETIFTDLLPVEQRFFAFDLDTGQELRLLTDEHPTEGEPLIPFKFITPIIKAKSGVPSMSGLSRILTWLYIFKNYNTKHWATFAELYGMPIRVGKYESGTVDADLDILEQALQDLSQDSSAMIPETMKIEFIEANQSGSVNHYDSFKNFLNTEMSKAVLGQTLTSDGSDGGSGSFALGQIHNDIRLSLVTSDAKKLSNAITDQLIVPLVWYNFGPVKKYPRFNLAPKASKDLTQLATNVQTLQAAGLKIPAAHVYEEFGIPKPKASEEVLEAPAPPSPFGLAAKEQIPEPGYILAAKKKLQQLRKDR